MKHIELKGRYLLLTTGLTLLCSLIVWHTSIPGSIVIGGLLVAETAAAARYTARRELLDILEEDQKNSNFWAGLGLLGYAPIAGGATLITVSAYNQDYVYFWPTISFLILISGCNIIFILLKNKEQNNLLKTLSRLELVTKQAERYLDIYERYYSPNVKEALTGTKSIEARREQAIRTITSVFAGQGQPANRRFEILMPEDEVRGCITKLFESDFRFSGKVINRKLCLHALILLCLGGQWCADDDYLIHVSAVDPGVNRGATFSLYRYFDFDQRNDPYFAEPVPREGLPKKSPTRPLREKEMILANHGGLAYSWEKVNRECLPSHN